MKIDKDIPIPEKPVKAEKPQNSGRKLFTKGHKLATGRPKGSKNRITNDIRQCFHKVYDRMGRHITDEKTGKPLTGDDAMLLWALDNPTEFYRLYGKMIPQAAELPSDLHEDFVDDLIFKDELPKLVDVKDVTDMGKAGQKQLSNGEPTPNIKAENADNAPLKDEPDYIP